jgi:hypothetical protein
VKESLKLARQAKEPCDRVPTVGIVGAVDSEAEEAEETEEAERADSSLEARLERAMAEPDYEREETFQYLKEHRKRKRLDESSNTRTKRGKRREPKWIESSGKMRKDPPEKAKEI